MGKRRLSKGALDDRAVGIWARDSKFRRAQRDPLVRTGRWLGQRASRLAGRVSFVAAEGADLSEGWRVAGPACDRQIPTGRGESRSNDSN